MNITYSHILGLILMIFLAVSCEGVGDGFTDPLDLEDTVTLIQTIPKTEVIIDTCLETHCFYCSMLPDGGSLFNELLSAFSQNSEQDLDRLLSTWNQSIPPRSIVPDSLEHIYDLFLAFYSPWDMDRYLADDSRIGETKGTKYYIVQPGLTYRIQGAESRTIEQFRPLVEDHAERILYLESDYAAALDCYMNGDSLSSQDKDGGAIERYGFVRNSLTFFEDSTDTWSFISSPVVDSIRITSKQSEATVFFRINSQRWISNLSKEGDEWYLLDSSMLS